MNQRDKAKCYDWLRVRLMISHITGKNIVPLIPLDRAEVSTEDYAKRLDAAVSELLEGGHVRP